MLSESAPFAPFGKTAVSEGISFRFQPEGTRLGEVAAVAAVAAKAHGHPWRPYLPWRATNT